MILPKSHEALMCTKQRFLSVAIRTAGGQVLMFSQDSPLSLSLTSHSFLATASSLALGRTSSSTQSEK
uniref:Uncharacterized protein n=1 Tax=Anguilla anguilla TaxID=7936 RepID=A0A0E9XLY0_ANGAN